MGGRGRRCHGHLVWAICSCKVYSALNHGRNRPRGQWQEPKRAGQQARGSAGPYLHHFAGALDTPKAVYLVYSVYIVYPMHITKWWYLGKGLTCQEWQIYTSALATN